MTKKALKTALSLQRNPLRRKSPHCSVTVSIRAAGLAHILGQFSAKEETASVASIASGKIASGYGLGGERAIWDSSLSRNGAGGLTSYPCCT